MAGLQGKHEELADLRAILFFEIAETNRILRIDSDSSLVALISDNFDGRLVLVSISEIENSEEAIPVYSESSFTIDVYYYPWSYHNTTELVNSEKEYYISDHLGNTRITYIPDIVDANNIEYTLRNVFDYYPFGGVLRMFSDGSSEKFLTTQHERDTESGLDYRFARFYDSDLGRFLGVEPLAADYPSLSPFAYVANNPLKYIDPDGREIVNPYEKYRQYSGLEQRLRSNVTSATNRAERRMAKRELKANWSNIQGFDNYRDVQGLLSNFKQANESEYNHVNNLELNRVKIDVVVGLNDNFVGDKGQVGQTNYSYGSDPKTFVETIDFQTGESYLLPTKIENDKIWVTLYSGGRTLRTLANEFGDAIFGVENPAESYRDTKSEVPYFQKSSTKFSDKYEDYILKGGIKPNPQDY